MFNSGEDVGALVADIGSFTCRIGYAGEEMPRTSFQTATGFQLDPSGRRRKSVHEPIMFEENLQIDNAIRDGIIADIDMYEDIWHYAMKSAFPGVDLKDHPILFSEKPYNPPLARKNMTELMFEKFGLPAMFISKDSSLICYSVGKTTGMVVDVGASGTVIAPVVDGWIDQKGLNRGAIGGRAMDAHLLSLLESKGKAPIPHFRQEKDTIVPIGPKADIAGADSAAAAILNKGGIVSTKLRDLKNVHPSYDAYARLEAVRDLKETVIRMADSAVADDPRLANLPGMPYVLPDGTIMDVGIDRFACTELLLDATPWKSTKEYLALATSPVQAYTPLAAKVDSVPNLIYNSVLRSDPEIHQQLFGSLIISGGAAATDGTVERIRNEMEKLVPGVKIKMMSANGSERALCPWLGGSIVASLGSFHEMWMSKADYDEYGASLIDRKCP